MKGRVVALDHLGGRRAAALIQDGRLDDFLIDPGPDAAPSPGSVFRAICDRPLKGQGGMMVRLPHSTGFLRHGRGLRPGESLLVQVTGYSEAGKAVPVTDRLLFKSRYVIVTPGAPGLNVSRAIRDEDARVRLLEIAADCAGNDPTVGLIIRSAAQHGAAEDIAADIVAMLELSTSVLAKPEPPPALLLAGPDAHALARREWPEPDVLAQASSAFSDHGVHEMVAALASPRLDLPNGAFAFVEPTRALVAVDVNTGADTSPAAALKATIALARALPRHLRCRGLGGQITIDFAPLAKKDRRQVEQVLKSAFAHDPIETALPGWTPLGHFELQRKRERLPVVVDWLE